MGGSSQMTAAEPVWEISSYSTDAHLQLGLKSANELVREGAQAEIALRIAQKDHPPIWAEE
jgi:hypothetical protein